VRFFPWVMIHLMAVPLAIQLLLNNPPLSPVLRGEGNSSPQAGDAFIRLAATLYLFWLFQAVVLQHYFDYVQLPAILLAIGLVAWFCATTSKVILKGCLLAFLFLCPVLRYPLQLAQRWPYWERSVREGSTAEVKDGLTLLHRVEWRDLKKVEDFLRERHVQDGELTCFSIQTISLYNALEVRPAMRHLILQSNFTIFANHRNQIREEVDAGLQNYIVVDLWKRDVPYRDIPVQAGDTDLPDWIFPKNYKQLYPEPHDLLFRAGRYVVFTPRNRFWHSLPTSRPGAP
jgi:hypothetical protein